MFFYFLLKENISNVRYQPIADLSTKAFLAAYLCGFNRSSLMNVSFLQSCLSGRDHHWLFLANSGSSLISVTDCYATNPVSRPFSVQNKIQKKQPFTAQSE